MQPITEPALSGPQAPLGRWIWRLTGLLTLAALAALALVAVARGGQPSPAYADLTPAPARTVTISQPVTDVHVQSNGAPISVTQRAGHGPVRVTETLTYDTAGPRPAVTGTVTRGLLTLSAPACPGQYYGGGPACSVGFSVSVPDSVTVTAAAEGGPVTLSGTGAADIRSAGGPVFASGLSGPLNVTSEGGQVTVNQVAGSAVLDSGSGDVAASGIRGKLTISSEGGQVTASGTPAADIDSGGAPVTASSVSGPLSVRTDGGSVAVTGAGATRIDSGSGPVSATAIRGPLTLATDGGDVQAQDVTGTLTADTGGATFTGTGIRSAAAVVTSEGGGVTLGFATAPESVRISTGGWNATLSVPGGPYKITADAATGASSVSVPVSSRAHRSLNVSTDGGELQISP
jgi:DUF4097 and DUF4098 domain-containing protein YvlB